MFTKQILHSSNGQTAGVGRQSQGRCVRINQHIPNIDGVQPITAADGLGNNWPFPLRVEDPEQRATAMAVHAIGSVKTAASVQNTSTMYVWY